MMNHTNSWMGDWFGSTMGGLMWIWLLGGLVVLVLMVVVIIRRFRKRVRSDARKRKR